MSIAFAANCARRECRQSAVRMIHRSPAMPSARGNGASASGPYLLTLRCSVCGHTWAVMQDTSEAVLALASRERATDGDW